MDFGSNNQRVWWFPDDLRCGCMVLSVFDRGLPSVALFRRRDLGCLEANGHWMRRESAAAQWTGREGSIPVRSVMLFGPLQDSSLNRERVHIKIEKLTMQLETSRCPIRDEYVDIRGS